MTTATEQTRHGCLACGRPIPIMDWFCNDDCKQYAAMADQEPPTQPREERREHTPTPWQLSDNYTDVVEIWSSRSDGTKAFLVAEVPADTGEDASDLQRSQAATDAAFIVRAVNSHAALVVIAQRVVDKWTPETGRQLERLLGTELVNLASRTLAALAEGKGE